VCVSEMIAVHLSAAVCHACVHHPVSVCSCSLFCRRHTTVSTNVHCVFSPSVRSSGQILLPRYLMNGLSNLDETYSEYSKAPTNDLIKFWSLKVKVTASGRRHPRRR